MGSVGALIIGQSPRPDLVDPLSRKLPEAYQVLQAGALDGVNRAEIRAPTGNYPLTTRLRDGSIVAVDEDFLAPRLQSALEELEAQCVVASLLLCAGTFVNLKGTRPLFKPFDLGRELLRQLGIATIGVIAPIPEQVAPIRRRWQAAGFKSMVWSADVRNQDASFKRRLREAMGDGLECIILDYVGHSVSDVERMQHDCQVPVIDLGQLAMATLTSTLGMKDGVTGQ